MNKDSERKAFKSLEEKSFKLREQDLKVYTIQQEIDLFETKVKKVQGEEREKVRKEVEPKLQ